MSKGYKGMTYSFKKGIETPFFYIPFQGWPFLVRVKGGILVIYLRVLGKFWEAISYPGALSISSEAERLLF